MVTWGSAYYGADCSAVQDQLRDLQQILASRGAFAAILGDGSVVTWAKATAVRYRISCEMYSRSKLVVTPVTWGTKIMVATAVWYSITCEMCSRSKLLIRHLLQS